MRSLCLLSLLSASAGCVVPPLDVTGKTCSSACPSPHACRSGVCVGPDGRLCAALAGSKQACLDFEGSTTLDQPTQVQGGQVRVLERSARHGTNSLEASIAGGSPIRVARLSLPLPQQWMAVSVDFDFETSPPTSAEPISYAEILCIGQSVTGPWLFSEGTPSRLVARSGLSRPSARLQTALSSGVWSHARLTLERTPALQGTIRVDQAEVTLPVDDCGGTWTVEVGLSGTVAVTASYDDVVVDVR